MITSPLGCHVNSSLPVETNSSPVKTNELYYYIYVIMKISIFFYEYSSNLDTCIFKSDNFIIIMGGNHDKYYLATWTTQDFSYSLSVDEGIDLETILNIIQNSME